MEPLSPQGRRAALEALATTELDVLVIGGGVVGAGAALDAVTRGLSTGLVEMRDYAAGTSSRSTKLFHGGLRYLEQFDFPLVLEALRERSLMLETLCPHLVRPVRFIYPVASASEAAYVSLGVGVYDVMGAGRGVPHHMRYMSRRKALQSFPSGKASRITAAISFYEGLTDDARHTLTVARTAAAYGAHVANSLRVVAFLREADRVVGAVARDLETGAELTVRARQVINAAGVWTDEVQQMVGGRGPFQVRASKGVHLVVPRNRINSKTGIIHRTEKSLLFIVPRGSFWVIGTTDTEWALDRAHPAASASDIDYLLGHANALLADPLSRDDVVGVYAGPRPLLAGESDSTSKLSREHAVSSPVRGLTVIAGGKYTTYRVMAKDAVDNAARGLDPSVHLEDILTRRTRISIEVPDRGVDAAGEVADLAGPVLGWTQDQAANEVRHYSLRVEAEKESQNQPDDQTADAARLDPPLSGWASTADIDPHGIPCPDRSASPPTGREAVRVSACRGFSSRGA